MSCIVWNARGLIVKKNPSLVFIYETKIREHHSKNWKHILGFNGCFTVDCQGKRGGLILMWKYPLNVIVKSFSMRHIDCYVEEGENKWRFTGFYGNPDSSSRQASWTLLRRLCNMDNMQGLPWLVGGDFNEVCYDSEKFGGQSRAFREVLEDCSLQDLYSEGEFFTWSRGQQLNIRTP
ncbi:uncharacterized protein [Henckelia pumila]|uniref:uncharacterized protein n=1 Tax=Henckelia pumila TaxID=405737 RepID=UPI003C6E5576